MTKYKEKKFVGERALFQAHDIEVEGCTFGDGESPIKEGKNIIVKESSFQWKYPFWYCNDVSVSNSVFSDTARAGIWYTNHLNMINIEYAAPKGFRRCHDITLENVTLPNASETLWNCKDVTLKSVNAKGDYLGMGCENVTIDNFKLTGGYAFDGAKNLTIRNTVMITKDAFWNCENVTIYDSFILGQYFGWNSKNVTLINCTIESEQGMCYMENLVMKNCKLLNTDLAFEYSTVDVDVDSDIVSVKNPISGSIKANHIGEIIYDNEDVKEADTKITVVE